jgi:hypothetical protein
MGKKNWGPNFKQNAKDLITHMKQSLEEVASHGTNDGVISNGLYCTRNGCGARRPFGSTLNALSFPSGANGVDDGALPGFQPPEHGVTKESRSRVRHHLHPKVSTSCLYNSCRSAHANGHQCFSSRYENKCSQYRI